MKENNREKTSNHGVEYSTSQLFNFTKDSYLERTSRPIYALIFLLPFIIFYELGTIFLSTNLLSQTQEKIAAFVWLESFLEHIGFGSRVAWATPTLVVVIILLALQMASGKQWRFGIVDTLPMGVECTLWAVPLIVLSLFLNSSIPAVQDNNSQFVKNEIRAESVVVISCSAVRDNETSTDAGKDVRSWKKQMLLANIVMGVGAGIYEELVFRLILICLLMLLFQDFLRLGRTSAIILSILISAAMFSAHHHIDFLSGQLNQRDPFSWKVFIFRTVAGSYFAILFAMRGFGITAGTHAFYDIIATIINTVFFE